jgi:hypothetical protein
MSDNRPNLADTVPEPEDGTVLVLENDFREFTPIIRDDEAASDAGYDPKARWFIATDNPEEAETWREIVMGSIRLHSLTEIAKV